MPASDALLAPLAAEPRALRREGIFALWLAVRAAEDLLVPDPPPPAALKRRLRDLTERAEHQGLPAPIRRALPAAVALLRQATPESALLALSQLVAPAADALGAETGALMGEIALAARRGRGSRTPAGRG